ncbi:uncharacterized protein LOC116140456 [Pistacia vera]|uniref:uncharacterized protein LOC116127527 n=1 Tax=Pistacia vera TaxID=55513 RepID=UPI00126383B7|nr:uncharacterized protein LOC116127527 [Pistacia vera]XP_031281938.1 uncharacterized protein LOC116140456 [Pistacia vera]
MEPEPWEALDIDEAEDSLLLLPCKRKSSILISSTNSNKFDLRPCSFNPTIPGPAGAVQSAMHRKSSMSIGEEPIPTQEYIRRVVEDPSLQNDDDFARDPWLFAVDFVRRQGLVGEDGVAIGTPLSCIKNGINMDKISQIVAIVKSSTPNGLGGMMVTLKDPTGTIDASIHHRVLTESEFSKDISVGTVLILQKVAVFSPSHSTHYLNITLGNIVKVISKDCEIPLDQTYPSLMVKHASTTAESSEKSWEPPKTVCVSQGRTEGILNCLRQNTNMRGAEHNDKELEKGNASVSSSFCDAGDSRNNNSVEEEETIVVSVDVADGRKGTSVDTGTDDHEQGILSSKQPGHLNEARKNNILGKLQCTSVTEKVIDTPNSEENENTNGVKKQRQMLISRGSLPEWTDEQLDELLSFD